jgi:hypothetical protein
LFESILGMVALGIIGSRNGRFRNGRVRNGRSRIARSRIGPSTNCNYLIFFINHLLLVLLEVLY